MKKTKIIFDDSSLPFILEAIGYEIDDKDCVTDDKGKTVHKDYIAGFGKEEGIILK